MATARMLSTTIATDAQLARLGLLAEMMFLKTIPHLDRDGMITGEPLALLGIISPMRFSEVHAHMPALVDEWCNVGLVLRFASPQGPVLFFKGFLKQQTLKYSRERASQFPTPPGYIRTPDGLKAATSVAWIEGRPADSGFLPENPAKGAVLPDLPVQQQQQQQQQSAPEPAAAADQPEAVLLLAGWGVGEPSLSRLAQSDPCWIRGWMWEAEQAGDRIRDRVAFLVARLKAGERPPRVLTAPQWDDLHADDDPDSYEALKRRYVPDGWADIVRH